MLSRRKIISSSLIATIVSGLCFFGTALAQSKPLVTLETTKGNIVIELDTENTPNTAQNFLNYVDNGFYDNTIFHRVINNFMIQGGGFDVTMKEKETQAPIPLEIAPALKNKRGSIAMARTSDPNSATSQFFINVVDNPNLDAPNPDGYGYAVFGRVIEGMDVVDQIKIVQTGNHSQHANVPLTPIVIKQATVQMPY